MSASADIRWHVQHGPPCEPYAIVIGVRLGLSSSHAERMMKRSASLRRLVVCTGSLWQLRADNDAATCAYRTQEENTVRQLALEVSEPWYSAGKYAKNTVKGETVRTLHHEVRPRLSDDCVEGVGAVLSSRVPCGIVRQSCGEATEHRRKDADGWLWHAVFSIRLLSSWKT